MHFLRINTESQKLEKIIHVLNCYNNKNCAQFCGQRAFVSPKTFIFFKNWKLLEKFV